MRHSMVQVLGLASVLVLFLLLVWHPLHYSSRGLMNSPQYGTLLKTMKDSVRDIIREELQKGQQKRSRDELNDPDLPTIYVITPTFKRQEQMPDMTRLAQTLMHVRKLHWIVAEDSDTINHNLLEYLNYTGIPYTYLLTPMPSEFRKPKIKRAIPKGVANRNAGLTWVKNNANEGVIFMADDDNTYDLRVFEEMRYTKRLSMWPVGLVTHYGLSSPVIMNGEFVTWYDGWISNRKFPVDMAGFAFSVSHLKQVNAVMPYRAGYEEDGFLQMLKVPSKEIEFKADDCTKIYVWHTRTKVNMLSDRRILSHQYNNTNLRSLQNQIMLKP